MKRKMILVLLAIILLLVTVVPAYASGSTEVYDLSGLVDALNNANDGDVIVLKGLIQIDSSMTLGDASKKVTIKGTDSGRIDVTWSPSNIVMFYNLDFDGNGVQWSSPMIDAQSEVVFESCTLKNCTSTTYGGAVNLWDNYATFRYCTFEGNTGVKGSAIMVNGSSNVSIEDCVFKNNSADLEGYADYKGGAICVMSAGANVNMINTTMTGNKSNYIGGAISNAGNLTITSCKIYGNTATGSGKDIHNEGTLTLNDSTDALVTMFESLELIPEGWNDESTDSLVSIPSTITGNKDLTLKYSEATPPDDGDDDGDGGSTPTPAPSPTPATPTNTTNNTTNNYYNNVTVPQQTQTGNPATLTPQAQETATTTAKTDSDQQKTVVSKANGEDVVVNNYITVNVPMDEIAGILSQTGQTGSQVDSTKESTETIQVVKSEGQTGGSEAPQTITLKKGVTALDVIQTIIFAGILCCMVYNILMKHGGIDFHRKRK